ncbi:MAG: hypothetical protein EAZ70_08085 [Runella slithyformis]|nr:MAG: hypothetical protein EAY79_05660 [Runella slithyformis]TAF26744.1 MAG: hypothetical protein EAZ70_08085 [Runella slithyformis]TAF45429.1 MAG: hypothetical protein EAZ63_11020 [Runella slithyformis]TAF79319.1 MAG: hypothetical protein EAZ50_11670 [Runella slithyformis]
MSDEDFEKQWRKAFEGSSQKPPLSVWEKIETRLDQHDDAPVVILPWWNRFGWAAGVAAAVSVLLVVGWSWWQPTKPTSEERIVAATRAAKPAPPVGHSSAEKGIVAATRTDKPAPPVGHSSAEKGIVAATRTDKPAPPIGHSSEKGIITARRAAKPAPPVGYSAEEGIIAAISSLEKGRETTERVAKNNRISDQSTKKMSDNELVTSQITVPDSPSQPSVLVLNPLAPKGYKRLLGLAARKPWVHYETPKTNKQPPTPTKIYWAALNVAPTSFNSGLSIPNAGGSSFKSLNTSNTAPSERSRAALSVVVQSQVGLQLGKRWSLETGIGYLQGNSVYSAATFLNTASNFTSNSLEVAIAQSPSNNSGLAMLDASKNASPFNSPQFSSQVVQSTLQEVKNQYGFLQVPVQAGYALWPKRNKLSVWAVGGFINNIRLQNQFENGRNNTLTFGTGEGPFRTFSVATTTGLRLQYQLATRWSATLTGNYQRTLGTTTYANAAFAARPWWVGMGWGLRYGF